MGVTYHFGYPNMQRIVAIDEAVNNAQNGEKYQVNYRGKYRPLPPCRSRHTGSAMPSLLFC